VIDINKGNSQIHVTNEENSIVSVIDGATNIVIATLPVGDQSPYTITDA
jgi:YVTN family beta-propeller protein